MLGTIVFIDSHTDTQSQADNIGLGQSLGTLGGWELIKLQWNQLEHCHNLGEKGKKEKGLLNQDVWLPPTIKVLQQNLTDNFAARLEASACFLCCVDSVGITPVKTHLFR